MISVGLFLPFSSDRWHSIEKFSGLLTEAPPSLLPGIQIKPFRPPPHWNTFGEFLGRRILYPLMASRFRADVYHIVDPSYAPLLQFLPASKTIITCHDLEFWRRRNILNTPVRWWILSQLFRAGRIVTPSIAVKDELLALGREMKQPLPMIDVIANSTTSEFQPPQNRAELRSSWGFTNRPLLLNIANTHWPRKNFGFLVQVLDAARKQIPDIHLIQVGPPFSAENQALIESKKLSQTITRFENLTLAKIIELYQMADLFVHPSTYEGFGYPILESLACDTPVLVSDIPAFNELLGQEVGLCPLTVEIWVANIETILQSSDYRTQTLQRQRTILSRYSPEKQIANYQNIYHTLSGKPQ